MNLYDIVTPMTVDEAKATSQRLDAKCWKGKHKEGTKVKGGVRVNNCVPNEGIAEAQTDYQKRRQRERDIDAGKPVPKQRQSSMTDYQKRRAEQKRQEQLGENAWNDGTNDWTSEHDQWTKESTEPVTELKIDPRKAKPGQTQDEKYKGWNLRYQMRPAAGSKEYLGRADHLQSKQTKPIGPLRANSAEELVQQLKNAIDTGRGSNPITTGRVTIFFNSNLAKEVIGHGGNIYADIEKHGNTPLLLLSAEDQGGMQLAVDRSSTVQKSKEGHVGSQAFQFPAEKAKAMGLTLARYAVGSPVDYAPGITAIPLEFRSEVYPGETIKIGEPGVTVSPPKMGQTMESSNDPVAIDSTSPVGGNVQEGRLQVGDPVIVTAPNAYEGKTGEIAEFSPSGKFVIVNLYNHGRHSMHLSDVEYNQYADEEDEYEELDELDVNTLKSYADKRGAQVAAMKANNPNPQTGSKEWVQQAVPAQQVGLANRKIARKERQAGVAEATPRHFGPKGAGTELARQIRANGELDRNKQPKPTGIPKKNEFNITEPKAKIQVKKDKGVAEGKGNGE